MGKKFGKSGSTKKIQQPGNYYTFAAGWYKGYDVEQKTTPCSYSESEHCGATFETGRNKPCGGCRTRIYCAGACGNKLHFTESAKGNSCPDATRTNKAWMGQFLAKDTGGQSGFVCVYKKADYFKDDVLRNLSKSSHWTTSGLKGGPSNYEQLLVGTQKPNTRNYSSVGKGYCEQVDNLDKVIHDNGETCYRYLARKVSTVAAKQKSADYCKKKLSAIKSELCTPENLGKTKHDALAGKYCETDDGKKDEWCACYNAFTGKCKQENWAEYAGCEGVRIDHKKLIGDIPPDQLSGSVRQQLTDRMHCRNNVCKIMDGFKPDGADKCDLNLNLCIQDVNVAGHLVDSGVQLTCNNTMNTGSGEKDSEGTESEGAGGAGGTAKKDDGKKSRTLIFGATTTIISSCCLIILIVIMLMTSGGRAPKR